MFRYCVKVWEKFMKTTSKNVYFSIDVKNNIFSHTFTHIILQPFYTYFSLIKSMFLYQLFKDFYLFSTPTITTTKFINRI